MVLLPEWSHFISAEDVTGRPVTYTISPADDQMASLCARLGVVSVEKLIANVTLQRHPGNMIVHVSGDIDAQVTQACVITAELVKDEIKERFEAWYADQDQAVSLAKARRERLSPKDTFEQPIMEESEDPEPIIDGQIDLGELVTQYLSLSINPYPRSKEALLREESMNVGTKNIKTSEIYDNPFAALKDWKERGGR